MEFSSFRSTPPDDYSPFDVQVFLEGEKKPHHVLIEVATYPEKRAVKQALDDLALAYSVLGHLPELLMLVLRDIVSPGGWAG